jgi:small subunit ribosomal protein S3
VVVAGKLTGSRARVQKFTEGYVKHCGEPANTIVEKGYAVAIKKLGVIGVQVKIIPPGANLPDHFEMIAPKEKPSPKPELDVTEVGEDIGEEFEEELIEDIEDYSDEEFREEE